MIRKSPWCTGPIRLNRPAGLSCSALFQAIENSILVMLVRTAQTQIPSRAVRSERPVAPAAAFHGRCLPGAESFARFLAAACLVSMRSSSWLITFARRANVPSSSHFFALRTHSSLGPLDRRSNTCMRSPCAILFSIFFIVSPLTHALGPRNQDPKPLIHSSAGGGASSIGRCQMIWSAA
jgi:hypothetical protein